MPLKSKEWFYKQCLKEVKDYTPLAHLSWNILEKGVGQKDKARGHVTQAIGVCQEFLAAYPDLPARIETADPTVPFDPASDRDIRRSFTQWIAGQAGPFGRRSFGYSYDTFKNIVTRSLGGTRTGGGGGDDEFKRVLRLMAAFGNRK